MEPGSEQGGFVLVLDDNEPTAKVIARSVLRSGVAKPRIALTLEDGGRFLRSFRAAKSRPTVVRRLCGAIVDVLLPGGIGFDIVVPARAISPDLPILMLTGDTMTAHANEAQRLGVEFAYKPVGDAVESFLKRVETHDSWFRHFERFAREKGLTPRQTEIVGLALEGFSHKEIAARLGLAPGTLKDHVHKLLGRCRPLATLDEICVHIRRGADRR